MSAASTGCGAWDETEMDTGGEIFRLYTAVSFNFIWLTLKVNLEWAKEGISNFQRQWNCLLVIVWRHLEFVTSRMLFPRKNHLITWTSSWNWGIVESINIKIEVIRNTVSTIARTWNIFYQYFNFPFQYSNINVGLWQPWTCLPSPEWRSQDPQTVSTNKI